ncbi:MAG: RNA ligase family protein [Candidatus Zapsychrus exili]|nr:RNA ligase family protein [Candidatus Zapsychrus exili]
MSNIPAFTKIYNIGHKEVENIFDGPVEVTEKIDGSQFCFGVIDGKLYIRSKGREIDEENQDSMFSRACDHVRNLYENKKLPEGYVFFCERLNRPRHVRLKYDRVPKNNLILFGTQINNGYCDNKLRFAEHLELIYYADRLDIELIPLIYKGDNITIAKLDELIDRKSILGDVDIEGLVIKKYDGANSPISAKYVSESFRERKIIKLPIAETRKEAIDEFIKTFRSEARWEKAVQHLRDDSRLENSQKDIGKLAKEINIDLLEEEESTIKEFFYKMYKKDFTKYALLGFADWYLNRLSYEN